MRAAKGDRKMEPNGKSNKLPRMTVARLVMSGALAGAALTAIIAESFGINVSATLTETFGAFLGGTIVVAAKWWFHVI